MGFIMGISVSETNGDDIEIVLGEPVGNTVEVVMEITVGDTIGDDVRIAVGEIMGDTAGVGSYRPLPPAYQLCDW